MTATSIRARVRAEMTNEIKATARRHLAEQGANVSLRAVARDLGMVSSAIYRYFPSRDDLLTALILDAYNALGEAVEAAEAGVSRTDFTGRWLAVCHAVRDWALARPHEYALIYGSPVPGYRAPGDTVTAATRTVAVLGRILQDATEAGLLRTDPVERLPGPVEADVARVGDALCPAVPRPAMSRGMGAWVQLFGMVSFELFGQFNNTIEDRSAFFDHQMRTQAGHLGLEPAAESHLPAGIGAPARRALAGAGYTRLDQLAAVSERELLALHGVGPKAIRILREALREHGLTLAG